MARRTEIILICDVHGEDSPKCKGGKAIERRWFTPKMQVPTGEYQENESGDKVEIMETFPAHMRQADICDEGWAPMSKALDLFKLTGEEVKEEEPEGQQKIPVTPPRRSVPPARKNSNGKKELPLARIREWAKAFYDIKERGRIADNIIQDWLSTDEGKPYR